jgi:hypothetical protein
MLVVEGEEGRMLGWRVRDLVFEKLGSQKEVL